MLRYRQRYNDFPFLIFNPKGDKLLDNIGAERLPLEDDLPKRGLGGRMVIYNPVPEDETDDAHVNRIIEQAMWLGNIGLYFDEGYSIPAKSKPFRRVLTQGRSKNVPSIVLSQRPVWLDKFVFSEASYIRLFDLVDINDRKKMRENTGIEITRKLPPFGSHYYNISTGETVQLSPGMDDKTVFAEFQKLRPKKRHFWS